jgi:hypothetical protein
MRARDALAASRALTFIQRALRPSSKGSSPNLSPNTTKHTNIHTNIHMRTYAGDVCAPYDRGRFQRAYPWRSYALSAWLRAKKSS